MASEERFLGELGGPGAPAELQIPDGVRIVFDSRDGFMVAVGTAGENVRVLIRDTAPEKSLLFTINDPQHGKQLIVRRGHGAVARISADGTGEYCEVGKPKPQLFSLVES